MLRFSCAPLLWWQGKEAQTRFRSLASFLAACYHLPVLDYFYPLYQPIDPQMLQEHKELQQCPEFSRDVNGVPFQLAAKRSLDELNCSMASFSSYSTRFSLTSGGAGSDLNWVSGR